VSSRFQNDGFSSPSTNRGEPAGRPQMRYMRRRRVGTQDRNGDPLDGLVNLWDIALVLAVAFLLAALTGIGLSGVLTSDKVTIVTNPGEPNMRVITKNGSVIESFGPMTGDTAGGSGTLLGEFYRLADGTVIYVPAGEATPSGAVTTQPTPVATPTPNVYPTPAPAPTPDVLYPTPTPTPFQTSPYVPTTPDTSTTETPGKKGGG
jgi:hypothetical protein